MKITKRILSLMLALIVAMAFMPGAVYADDPVDDGLVLSKTVNDAEDEITLEAYATGSSITHITTEAVPAHIELVLDESGSMDGEIQVGSKNDLSKLKPEYADYYKFNKIFSYEMRYQNGKWQFHSIAGWKDVADSIGDGRVVISKRNSLVLAANEFIDTVHNDAVKNNVEHEIGIVTYSSNLNHDYNLISVKSDSNVATLKGYINGLNQNGATRIDLGMKAAKTRLENDNNTNPVNKVAILFTDGEPTSGNTFEDSVANGAIKAAKDIKKIGTVWTIGLYDTTPSTKAVNFMKYTSSDYPVADSMTNHGSQIAEPHYYGTADNAEALSEIFQSIAKETTEGGAKISLSENAVVQDVMSPYFDVATSDANDIKVYTSEYKGNNSWGSLVPYSGDVTLDSITVDKVTRDVVMVSGFNYSENWCGMSKDAHGVETAHGKKLVIKFPIKDNGVGYGENVPTNDNDISAIYPGEPGSTVSLKNFPSPTVDIPYVAIHHSSDDTTDIIRVKDVNSSKLDITQPRDNIVKKQKKTDTECGDYKGVKGANIYGGAFSSDAYSTVATYKNGNPMCGTEIDLTKVKDETIYMKEVSNAFLQPKTVTLSKNATAVKASYLLTAADSNKYQKVGFDFGGREKEGAFTDKLTVKMVNGKTNVFTVGNLFNGLNGELSIVQIPYTDAGAATEIEDGKVYTANPFWVTLDGVKVTGIKSRTLTYKTGSLDKLAGEEYEAGQTTKGDNPAITDTGVKSTTQKYASKANGFNTMALYSTAAIVPDEDGSGELELGEVLVPSETYTFGVKGAAVEEQPAAEEEQPAAEEPAKEQVTVGKVKIKSVAGAKKNFTVKWNKVKNANGYKVAYKKNGSSKWTYKYVSSTKTSYKTSSKLKKGTYKVKVKAYKKVDGKKIYGKYSSTKSVKVK